ncbi:unnamed protein product [Microthlaspi erraticum]|uniref:Uncharacterized protein n=1 Tax=Microthlaspi erraticum TaxID=1685480 RepID=A0A6D2HY54_9BRAS|nr:unnamed protein product [Microthlaspi erraticum]
MNVTQPSSYYDEKEAAKTNICTTTSPFSYLDFTSSDSPGPCLDQQYLRSLLLAPQETQPPQFQKFINNNDISSFLLNVSSSSDSSFLGAHKPYIGSNIELTSAILAQEQCPPLVSLQQDQYQETCFEGNICGANQEDHHHALCQGAFGVVDSSSTSTIVGDQHQNQKHHMFLESDYSSFSSINEDLPSCFSIS